MKTIMKKLKGLVSKVKTTLSGVKTAVKNYLFVARAKAVLSGCRGEGFIDSGVSILIAVVIGALLLGGLY